MVENGTETAQEDYDRCCEVLIHELHQKAKNDVAEEVDHLVRTSIFIRIERCNRSLQTRMVHAAYPVPFVYRQTPLTWRSLAYEADDADVL